MNNLTSKYPIKGKVMLLFLMLAFFDYVSYGYIATFALIPISLFMSNFRNKMDSNFSLFLLFGIFYSVFGKVWVISNGLFLAIIFCSPFLYLTGKIIVSKNSNVSIEKIVFFLSLSLGAIVIYSIVNSIITSGFEGGIRNIEMSSTGEVMSATGMGARMSLIIGFGGLMMIDTEIIQEKMVKYFAIIFTGISLFCSFRIGTRTSTALFAISIIVAFLYNFKSYSFRQKIIFFTILTTLTVGVVLFFNSADNVYISYFRDRMNNDEFGVATGGGRTQLYTQIYELMWKHPMGIPKEIGTVYAHNLLLDVARIAGLIPFFILVIITIRFIVSVFKMLQKKSLPMYFKTFLLITSVTIFSQMMVEPIMEGVLPLFFFFCFYFGIISECVKKQ